MRRIIMLAAAAALVSTMAQGQDAETYRPTVPLMLPASDSFLQSFVRLINESDQAGEVEITAVDDRGNVFEPVIIQLAAGQTIHFNSGDLTDGNANKGIDGGIGAPMQGNWRLSVETNLDVQVLSFIRTRDGFLTAMHDVLPGTEYLSAKIFNPASNTRQQSRLRLINWGAEDAAVRIEGMDDGNAVRGPVALILPAGHSRTLTAVDLEEGAEGLEGTLGDGMGKWQLTLRGELRSIVAQSLLYASSGHISNTSRDGFSAMQSGDDGRALTGSGGADCSANVCYGAIAVTSNNALLSAAAKEGGANDVPLVAAVTWGYSTEIEANERAMAECGHSRCVVLSYNRFQGSSPDYAACAAAARGWAEETPTHRRHRRQSVWYGATLREAQFEAMTFCRDSYDDCELWEGVAACADGSHHTGE